MYAFAALLVFAANALPARPIVSVPPPSMVCDDASAACADEDDAASAEAESIAPDGRVILAAAGAATFHAACLALFPAPLVVGLLVEQEARRAGIRWNPPQELSYAFLPIAYVTFYLAMVVYNPISMLLLDLFIVGAASVSIDEPLREKVRNVAVNLGTFAIAFVAAVIPTLVGSYFMGMYFVDQSGEVGTAYGPSLEQTYWFWFGGALVHLVALPLAPTLATAIAVGVTYGVDLAAGDE